jgi:hypothetical protein
VNGVPEDNYTAVSILHIVAPILGLDLQPAVPHTFPELLGQEPLVLGFAVLT